VPRGIVCVAKCGQLLANFLSRSSGPQGQFGFSRRLPSPRSAASFLPWPSIEILMLRKVLPYGPVGYLDCRLCDSALCALLPARASCPPDRQSGVNSGGTVSDPLQIAVTGA
jgi:hypothetical protein